MISSFWVSFKKEENNPHHKGSRGYLLCEEAGRSFFENCYDQVEIGSAVVDCCKISGVVFVEVLDQFALKF